MLYLGVTLANIPGSAIGNAFLVTIGFNNSAATFFNRTNPTLPFNIQCPNLGTTTQSSLQIYYYYNNNNNFLSWNYNITSSGLSFVGFTFG
jgi:hypothetical protein